MLLVTSVGLSTAAQAATSPTVAGVPKATALVTVKAHKLATLPVKAHKTTSFTVLGVAGVPKTGVAAVVLKLVASKPTASGSLVAYATGAHRPSALSTSFTARHDASSTVVVTPGSKGRATVANLSAGSVRVVPTVVGWYRKATSVSAALTYFKAVTPHQAVSAKLASRGSLTVTATGHGVPATGTAGVVLEVSELTAAKSGKLTVSPAGAAASKVTALSFKAGIAATNLVTAAAGSKGRIVVRSSAAGAVRVRVDVVGYLVALSPAGGAPGSVVVTPHAGGALLSWTAAKSDPGAPVLRYEITVIPLAPAGASRVISTGTAVTSFDVTGLTVGGRYAFEVRAVTREGRSAPSQQTAPVTLAAPTAPTAVVAASAAAGSVTVTWAPSTTTGPAITGYTITGAHSGPVTVAASLHSYTFTGLTVGQTFVATVTATNAVGSATSAPSAPVLVAGAAGSNVTSAVSVDSAGGYHGSDATGQASASADGSYVVLSHPSVLDTSSTDANGKDDIFLRHAGVTTVISVPQGTTTTLNAASDHPRITPDGHWVVFDSMASLDAADTNAGRSDVYLYDTVGHTLTLISVGAAGVGDKDSVDPVISDDGKTIAFLSNSTNLVTGETASGHTNNVFVRDLNTGTTTRVSVPATGTGFLTGAISAGPSISGDGNLVGYSYDSNDAVVGDSNGVADALVYNRTTGTTTRVSTAANGAQANLGSGAPQLSDNGAFAVFQSDASNLVPGDTNGVSDIFEKNLSTGAITRVSVGNDGAQATAGSTAPFVSADGNRVLFTSSATNLVTGDTNAAPDAFLRVVSTGETIRVSLGAGGAQLPSGASASALSGNGLVALFTSVDPIAGASTTTDTQAKADVFTRTLG